MFDILEIICPIYFSIAIGFFSTRLGLFGKTDRDVIGKFVIHIAVPSLLFKAVAERQIGEILNINYVLTYLAGTLLLIALGMLWCRKVARLSPTTSAFYTMGMACSNSSFMGYPVLLITVAPVAGIAMALNNILENIIVTPLMLAFAEHGRAGSGRWYRVVYRSLARLFINPMIIGLVAGIVFSLLGWKLPKPVLQTVGMFSMTTGALALFFIGCTLVGLPIRGMLRPVMPIVVGKLILHPLAVFFSLVLMPQLGMPVLEPDLRMAAIVMAAMPMLSLYPILAQTYGLADLSAAALLITTIGSFFTLSGLLWLLKTLPI